MTGQRTGHFKGQWGSLLKLHLGADSPHQAKIAPRGRTVPTA